MLCYLEFIISGSLQTDGPSVVDTYRDSWEESDDKYGQEPKDLGYGTSTTDDIFQHKLYTEALAHNFDGSYNTHISKNVTEPCRSGCKKNV